MIKVTYRREGYLNLTIPMEQNFITIMVGCIAETGMHGTGAVPLNAPPNL